MATKEVKKGSTSRNPMKWTFLSNHAHVLMCIALEPDLRLRDVAEKVGITERAVQGIVSDLVGAGYLSRVRSGRRNRYDVHVQRPLRHPLVAHQNLSAMLELVMDSRRWEAKSADSKKRGTPTKRKRAASTAKGKPKD